MNASPLNLVLHPLFWMAMAAAHAPAAEPASAASAGPQPEPPSPTGSQDGSRRCPAADTPPRGRLSGPTPDLNGGRLVERWEPAAGEKRAHELRRLLGPGAVRQHLEDRLDWTGPAGERVLALVVSYPAPKGGRS